MQSPPFDEEIAPLVAAITHQFTTSASKTDNEILAETRKASAQLLAGEEAEICMDPLLAVEEKSIPGPNGDIRLVIVREAGNDASSVPAVPGIINIHGGGMTSGTAFTGLTRTAEWVKDFHVVAVSIDYRLAPEHRSPVPQNDCYTALVWIYQNCVELGIHRDRLVLMGASAGGGLAASVALMARDKGGPKLAAQFLDGPMLDDRSCTISCQQFFDLGTYTTRMNIRNWGFLLGDRSEGDVSMYEAPSRATSLNNLPPTYIDTGAAEPFRDEVVDYGLRLLHNGVDVEMHVWPGAPHAFGMLAPQARISREAAQTRWLWARKTFAKFND